MSLLNFSFNKYELLITLTSNILDTIDVSIVVSDLDLDCVYYIWETTISPGFDCWIRPLNDNLTNILLSSDDFNGLSIKVYNKNKRLIQSEKIVVNNKKSKIDVSTCHFPEHDNTGHSYIDFFFGDLCDGIDFSGVVIDAGANVGFFTYLCNYKGSKKIYCIEPDPYPFYYLNKNFKNQSNVVLINKAMTEKNEILSFALDLDGSVGSSAKKHTKADNSFVIKKETITIKDILKIEEELNLVKLDIEGSEFEVIEDLTSDEFSKINQFFIEFHFNPEKIVNKLLENNYNVEYKRYDTHNEVGFIYANKIK